MAQEYPCVSLSVVQLFTLVLCTVFSFYCIGFTIVGLKTQLKVETIAASGVLLMVVKWGAMSSKTCDAPRVDLFNWCLYISRNI